MRGLSRATRCWDVTLAGLLLPGRAVLRNGPWTGARSRPTTPLPPARSPRRSPPPRAAARKSASEFALRDTRIPLKQRRPGRLVDDDTELSLAPIGAIIGDNMANELRAVVDELGGEAVFGRRLNRDVDLQAAIREGFPQKVIEELMEAADLSIKELAACLDLSPRSLQRRRREGRLARYESDRIYRLARIVALAKASLGERNAAVRWLKRPNRALGGKAPLAVIDTELGARAVENVLGRIAFGGVS
jgi:putative toxin-antitoxin system antitoxin component (TIGR02293 family)